MSFIMHFLGYAEEKTRDFDMNLDAEFVNKIGRVIPNPQLSTRKKSLKEKIVQNLTEAIAPSAEAALERALSSSEGLLAVATEYNMITFSDPNYVKTSVWAKDEVLESIYNTLLTDKWPESDEETRYGPYYNGICIFEADKRYLEFFYLRFCHRVGILDSPTWELSPEDVDRLVTCGWLTDADFDFDFGRVLLARGVHNRIARQTGQLRIDGKKSIESTPPCQWTIGNLIKPSAQQILVFISRFEHLRLQSERVMGLVHCDAHMQIQTLPQVNPVWCEKRHREKGIFGLKEHGISDKRALAMIKTCDAAFVLPSEYNEVARYGRIVLHKPSESECLETRPLEEVEVELEWGSA